MSSAAVSISSGASYGTFQSTSFEQNGFCDHATSVKRDEKKTNTFGNNAHLSVHSNQDDAHVSWTGKAYSTQPSHQNDDFDNVPLTDGDHVPLIGRPKEDQKESTCERYTSCRWTLTYLGFLMIILFFCLRICISMALVCMDDLQNTVNSSETQLSNDSYGRYSPGLNLTENVWKDKNGTSQESGPVYIPADMQGLVLSSYYYGYSVTPLLGGMLAETFGGKRVLTVAMGASATFTLLTPAMIRLNVYLAVTFRVLLGMATGFCIPGILTMLSIWAPPHEKAKLVAIVFSGQNIGAILANFVSGFLCDIPVDEGWPFIFYTYGGLSLLWTILWQAVVHDTPEEHPRISDKELKMLTKRKTTIKTSKKTPRLPLKSFFTSIPCLALTYSQMCDFWLLSTCSTYTPIFFNQSLRFDTEMSGSLSSLPYVAAVVTAPTFAAIADRLHSGRVLSVTLNRKLFQVIANLFPAALLCGLGFLDQELRGLAVFMMTIVVGCAQGILSGGNLVRIDVAPRFAGSVTGLTAMVCNIAQIVSPLIISDITSDNRPESWSEVFFITAAISISGMLVFVLFGSAEEQEWAKDKSPEMTITVTPGNGEKSARVYRYDESGRF